MARRFQGVARRDKTRYDWSGSPPQTSFVSVAASTAQRLETVTPFDTGMTVIRVRGLITVGSDQQSATELGMGAFGLGLVSEQASTLGITALPLPDSDSGWKGWLWHSYFAFNTFFRSASGISYDVQRFTIDMDSKAMRKMGSDMRLVLVVENSGAFGIEVFTAFRLLSKVN